MSYEFTRRVAHTRVRGGGLGSRGWVAKITGLHPQYHFERAFCEKRTDLSGSGRSGDIWWTLDGDGVYEYRGLCASSTQEASGYVRINGDLVEEITRSQAQALLAPTSGEDSETAVGE